MRSVIIIILWLVSARSFCQEKTVEVTLAENVKLTMVKDNFDPATRQVEVSGGVVMSIDQGLVFGTDGELPRSYLKKATLHIGSNEFKLQVDGMFNPWLDDYFNAKVFKVIRQGETYIIRGAFSDGAGYYAVEWVVVGKGCTRTILTNDERILFEYMEN